jgi:uncharacterized protein (TIGR00730 family)
MEHIKRICVYCGSSSGLLPEYSQAASELGTYLAANEIEIVYGGSSVGLMTIVADSALKNNGTVIGVIPNTLAERVGHKNLSQLHIVKTMHERKQLMFDLSDAFICLPGGIGSMEETFEILTWSQLGFHEKPIGFLNIRNYFNHLLSFLDHAVKQGFVQQIHRDMIYSTDSIPKLIDHFRNDNPIIIDKWIDIK